MRQALVFVAMLGCGSAADDSPSRVDEPRVIAFAGEMRDEVACAAPAIQAIQRHPNWELTFQDRVWDDVVDDTPDETIATVRITADHAVWTDGDLPQTIELMPGERANFLAAVQRSCAEADFDPDANGYSGHYITVSYGAVPTNALRIPGRSPALIDTRAVLDRIRARYVQSRLATARAMTVTLSGPRNNGEGWRRYFVTVHSDGRVTDAEGEMIEPLAAMDLVDVLDWALQLPARVTTPRPVTGTIDIAGSKKPIALDLVELWTQPSAWRSPFLDKLLFWGRLNLNALAR